MRASPGTLIEWLRSSLGIETDDCVIWPFGKSKGYGALIIDRRQQSAHGWVAEHTIGKRPDGMEAAHSCGVRACVNRRHLRWATPADNQSDRIAHGTDPAGERNGRSKLTETDVRAIRIRLSDGETQTAIGASFGVSHRTIWRIANHETWMAIDDDLAE